jgi:hypothetical protein
MPALQGWAAANFDAPAVYGRDPLRKPLPKQLGA